MKTFISVLLDNFNSSPEYVRIAFSHNTFDPDNVVEIEVQYSSYGDDDNYRSDHCEEVSVGELRVYAEAVMTNPTNLFGAVVDGVEFTPRYLGSEDVIRISFDQGARRRNICVDPVSFASAVTTLLKT